MRDRDRLDQLELDVRQMRATWADATTVAAQLQEAADEFDRGLSDARRAARKMALLARRLTEVLASAAMVVLLLAIVACGGSAAPAAASHSISGDLTLRFPHWAWATQNSPCYGDAGYTDIQAGAQVTVRDETNKVVAVSSLGAGTPTGPSAQFPKGNGDCRFPIASVKVPAAAVYQVEVAHRGSIAYPKGDLEKSNWKVSLTLGS